MGDVQQRFSLSLNSQPIAVSHHFASRLYLATVASANLHKHFTLLTHLLEDFNELFVYVQSALLCLGCPFFRVAVTLEPNTLSVLMQFCNDFAKGYSFIQLLSGQLEFFRQSRSDDGHREASILRGSESSKLELVASVSVWTRAISISVFLVNIKGEAEHSILQVLLLGALFPIDESADCLSQIG